MIIYQFNNKKNMDKQILKSLYKQFLNILKMISKFIK